MFGGRNIAVLPAWALSLLCALPAQAYDSGSTGDDGSLIAIEDMVVELPADGVLNYTEVNIASGVTVSFKKNRANTPVRLLVGGDVVVAGTLSVDGGSAAPVGALFGGDTSDDGNPGAGGPGGYGGGRGGRLRSVGTSLSLYTPEDALAVSGEWGHGPGGGAAGRVVPRGSSYTSCRNTSANFADLAGVQFARVFSSDRPCYINGARSIQPYGTATLLPLIGGSGGGGARASASAAGAGGGGGGGALLIAASGAVNITGTVSANGGFGGAVGPNLGSAGGDGSGGAIRIIATTISGNGQIRARSRRAGTNLGRIRLEAERFLFSGATNPIYTLGEPGPLYYGGRPSLRIVSVGAQTVPASPSGDSDVTFAETVAEAVPLSISASNVPLGTEVTVRVVPAAGTVVLARSGPLAGSLEGSTATATVVLPAGPSVLQALASFEVSLSDAQAQSLYMPYTGGERVARVSMGTGDGGGMKLVTVSGREVSVPAVAAR